MKTMNVCAHQPVFLPWVGFWNKLMQCDLALMLHEANYTRGDYLNRVKLGDMWLTVPVYKATMETRLCDAVINPFDVRKVARTIQQELMAKGKSKYGDRLSSVVKTMMELPEKSDPVVDPPTLSTLNMSLIYDIMMLLDMKCLVAPGAPAIYEESVTRRLQSVFRNISMPIEYYSGQGGMGYLKKDEWTRGRVYVQDVTSKWRGTVLQLIAHEPDPVDAIMHAATWREL